VLFFSFFLADAGFPLSIFAFQEGSFLTLVQAIEVLPWAPFF